MADNLPVWAIPPDWSNGILERLEWLTDVLTSRSGAEQRRQMRLTPRRTLEMGFTVTDQYKSLVELSLRAAGASDWYVPVWHDLSRVPAAITAGASTLAFPTTNREFANGGLAILYADPFTYQVLDILTVTSAHITVSEGVASAWPAGSKIMPLIRAKLTAQPSLTRYTDAVLSGSISFQSSRANLFASDFGSVPTYAGWPVLTTPPDETNNLTQTYQRLTTLLDSQTGLTALTDSAGFGFQSTQYRWFIDGLAEQVAFRKLLYALKGRLRPIWIPTFGQDLMLTKAVAHTSTLMLVRRCGYTDYGMLTVTGRQDIAIFLNDGRVLFNKITAASLADLATETLTISPLGEDLEVTSVKRISFMCVSRQDSDQIELSHQTDAAGLTVAATTFRDAPDLRNSGWDAWSPDDVSCFVEFSNLDQRVTMTTSDEYAAPNRGNMLVRTRHPHTAGKYYFEGHYVRPSASFLFFNTGIGLCLKTATYADIKAGAKNGFMGSNYAIGLAIYVDGATIIVDALAPYAHYFFYAVDLDAGLFWYSSGVADKWNNDASANPSTGTGGISIGALAGQPLYPFGVSSGPIGGTWDINLGSQAFFRAVPTGFHAGWPTTSE